MATARGFERKASLTPQEKLTCAYFHLLRGLAQQDLADLYGVNSARVNDAIMDVRAVLEWPGKGVTDAPVD